MMTTSTRLRTSKVMRAYTIIPDALYVERDADRQLADVLADMGRPGYVLVARQMGKTNLLLAAKRRLETADDLYVYVDLSNPLPDLRSCFRFVSDTIVSSFQQKFGRGLDVIERSRVGGDTLPPQIEHARELAAVLGQLTGVLVIILDEVDAIAAATYSDQFFAHIRSVYFSRVNIDAYNRLTYVLSGVAEPGELIKNRNISPFNIGEKIYLNDFSFDEVAELASRAGLQLSPTALERVFHWTRGNPRMTWDVLADLEASSSERTSAQVDGAVERLFLSSFDRPPVDHIRSLAQSDRAIRNAVIQIRWGKGSSLPDALKARLYLAGITGSSRTDVQLKNPIIDVALSDEWIVGVERARAGSIDVATELFAGGAYEKCVQVVTEYLGERAGEDDEAVRHAAEILSSAQYALHNYSAAIEALTGRLQDKRRSPAYYHAQIFRLGICHFLIGEFDHARRSFQEVVEYGPAAAHYAHALANLASSTFNLRGAEAGDEVERLAKEALARARENADGGSGQSEAILMGHLVLSSLARVRGDVALSLSHLEDAIGVATPAEQAVLTYRLAVWTDDVVRRKELLATACKAVAMLRPEVRKEATGLSNVLDRVTYADLLAGAFGAGVRGPDLEAALEYFAQASDAGISGPLGAVVHIAKLTVRSNQTAACQFAAWAVEEFGDAREPHAYAEAVKLACSSPDGRTDGLIGRYLQRYQNADASLRIDALDFSVLVGILVRAAQRNDPRQVGAVSNILSAHRASGNFDFESANFVLVDFLEMTLATEAGDPKRLVERAEKILATVPAMLDQPVTKPLVPKQLLENMRARAESVLRANLTVAKRYGRNEWVRVRYGTSIREEKFKRVEDDVIAGKAVILGRIGRPPK